MTHFSGANSADATSGWAAALGRLAASLRQLGPVADRLGVPPLASREWYELLEHKLLPQCQGEPWLVVAVVGGTNIGKSALFNQLAGETASAVSPMAAGTKHPVCLVPPGFADPQLLGQLFEPFKVVPWQAVEDPLRDESTDLLFWRQGAHVPPRLLLLDTPDVDSDAQVNWQRADAIRQSADVLLAVLTQQKYNDAAVKQFFRKAAEADKAVIVLFNQVDLTEDRGYWPRWLHTFLAETGIDPVLVYVVPYDRHGAAQRHLTFHDVGRDGRQAPGEPTELRQELAALQFEAIKLRTLRGALRQLLSADHGAVAYLQEIRQASGRFATARRVIEQANMARLNWPTLPVSVLVREIRTWWDTKRSPWARTIHRGYRKAWDVVTYLPRKGLSQYSSQRDEPLEQFRRAELETIAQAVQRLLDELERLAEVGDETLRPRLQALLTGRRREQLLERIRQRHAELPPLEEDYRHWLHEELDAWGAEHPKAVGWLRSVDHATAIARPVLSVSLFGGWFVVDGVVQEAAIQAASQSAAHLATEATIATAVTGGGDAVVAASGHGFSQAAARLLRKMQQRYAAMRLQWFYELLDEELLGDLLRELQEAALVEESPGFLGVEQALEELAQLAAR